MATKIYITDSDRAHLVKTLPNEVWLMLLPNAVDDAGSLHKISSASPHFKNMLLPRRNHILFDAVSQILIRQWKAQFSLHYLNLLIKCRKVCADWKDNVDNFLQDTEHHESATTLFKYYSERCVPKFEHGGSKFLNNHKDVSKFVEHFRGTHFTESLNPFPFRSLCADMIYEMDEDRAFADKLIDMLAQYGKHVWFLSFCVFVQDSANGVECLSKFRQILNNLPNLKALKIRFWTAPSIEEEDDMEEFLRQNPLPKLDDLEILECKPLPYFLLESLLNRNSIAIRQLDILCQYVIPNLTRLSKLSVLFMTLHTLEGLEIFEARASLLHLTKLYLNTSRLYPFPQYSIYRIFKILEQNFSETLVDLRLDLVDSPDKFPIPERLRLSKLQRLHLKLKYHVKLDFILPMAGTIKELCFDLHEVRENVKENGNLIQFYKYRGELHKSNIWELLPNLQKVQCQWPTFENYSRLEKEYCDRNNLSEYVGKCYLGHWALPSRVARHKPLFAWLQTYGKETIILTSCAINVAIYLHR